MRGIAGERVRIKIGREKKRHGAKRTNKQGERVQQSKSEGKSKR